MHGPKHCSRATTESVTPIWRRSGVSRNGRKQRTTWFRKKHTRRPPRDSAASCKMAASSWADSMTASGRTASRGSTWPRTPARGHGGDVEVEGAPDPREEGRVEALQHRGRPRDVGHAEGVERAPLELRARLLGEGGEQPGVRELELAHRPRDRGERARGHPALLAQHGRRARAQRPGPRLDRAGVRGEAS